VTDFVLCLCCHVQVFESNRPWLFDISLVKVVVSDESCLAVQQLHQHVIVAQDSAVGSLLAHIQLQKLPCLSDVCTRGLRFKQRTGIQESRIIKHNTVAYH